MPDSVARFTISIPPELLVRFDEVSAKKGYASRSEAVRDALRDHLVAHEWSSESGGAEVVGTITLVYEHDARRLSEELTGRQHQSRERILSTLHLHLDERNCLEVLVVRGPGPELARLADALISLRGVKFGRLVCATTGGDLE